MKGNNSHFNNKKAAIPIKQSVTAKTKYGEIFLFILQNILTIPKQTNNNIEKSAIIRDISENIPELLAVTKKIKDESKKVTVNFCGIGIIPQAKPHRRIPRLSPE